VINLLSFAETKRDRAEVKKNVRYSKSSTKETMTVTKADPVSITRKTKLGGEKRHALQRQDEKVPYFEGTSREEIFVL